MGILDSVEKDYTAEKLMRIIPEFMGKMIQRVPKGHRNDFALNIISALMNHGTKGMSEEEKNTYQERIVKKLKT